MEIFVIAESNFAVAIKAVEAYVKDGWEVAPFAERQYPFFDGIVYRIFMQREDVEQKAAAAPKQRRTRKTEDVAEQAVEE